MVKNRELPSAQTLRGLMTSAAGVGWIDPLFQYLGDKAQEERGRRVSFALRAAEHLSGTSREDLAVRIAAHPEGVDRLIRLLYLAGWNGHDEPLKMMGRCLVRGLEAVEVGNQMRAEQEEAILDSLHMLAPRHIQMLAIIQVTPNIANGPLADEVSPWDAYPDRTASELLARGLVEDPYGKFAGGPGEERFHKISPLGTVLLRAAEEVALLDL